MRRWRWLIAGIAVGLCGMVVRGCLHQEPYNSDDVQYFTQAQDMSLPSLSNVRFEKTRGRLSPNSMRFMFLAVPAIFSATLGSGPEPFYATIYTIALLFFVGVFVFSWVLSGPRVAVFTSAIWATSYAVITSDTRLVPDNFGITLALFGLALIAYVGGLGRANGVEPPTSRRWTIALAVLGGFLLWASFSCRASFFIFPLIGMIFALLARERRWTVVLAVVAGGLIGEAFELLYFASTLGDPFARWRTLFGFGSAMTKAGASPTSIYAGYDFLALFTRYPRVLWHTQSAEIFLHFAGLGVFIWWAFRWRQPHRLAKAVCGIVAYGFLAFAVTRVDPVVPLMREKVRYYVTAAPFFYIGVAELIELGLFHPVRFKRSKRFERWFNGRPRLIGAVALAVTALVANLIMGGDSPHFARNGNDGLLTAADVLEADSRATGRSRVLYQDMRTARVMDILLPEGWVGGRGYEKYLSTEFTIAEDGYLLLNWKRLNANVRRNYGHAPRTHNYYRIIESQPLVARHRRGGALVDLFYISRHAIDRDIHEVVRRFPGGWSRSLASGKSKALSAGDEVGFVRRRASRGFVYSGVGPVTLAPRGTELDGDTFYQVIFDARGSEKRSRVLGYLYWWLKGSDRPVVQYMGTVWVGGDSREYAMWTYLPQEARAHRIVLRARPGPVIEQARTRTLSVHPKDNLRGFGDAWPQVRVEKSVAAAVAAIRDDAKSGRPSLALLDELGSKRLLRQLGGDWMLVERDSSGYLVIDSARSGDEGSSQSRHSHALDQSFVVHRAKHRGGDLDVLYVTGQPVERPIIAEYTSFPRGWTRLLNSTKQWRALPAEGEFAFAVDDVNDEYLYTGEDAVWREQPGSALAGDQLVQVVVDASAPRPRELRAQLFWWPVGAKEPRRQDMGAIWVGPDAGELALWTYLPKKAKSHRIVLRSGSPTIIKSVRIRVLGLADGDRPSQSGGAW